jgi:hypothetical protein
MNIKRIILFVSALALAVMACSLGTGSSKTPEAAVTGFMDGLAQGKMDKILKTCAIDEMSENYHFDQYVEWLGKIFMPTQFQAPSEYPIYVEMNKAQLSAQIALQVKIIIYSLLSEENVTSGMTLQGMDADKVEAFIKDVDPQRLAGIQVVSIDLPNPETANESRYQQNSRKKAQAFGADEATERVALFRFEGRTYYAGFTLLRYGKDWKISQATSPMANITLGVQEISEDDYDTLVGK